MSKSLVKKGLSLVKRGPCDEGGNNQRSVTFAPSVQKSDRNPPDTIGTGKQSNREAGITIVRRRRSKKLLKDVRKFSSCSSVEIMYLVAGFFLLT